MFLEEITKWVDDGSPVDSVYLDFQKVFDKVPHKILLLKLKEGDFKVEICSDWGTTGISIRSYTVFNKYK